LLERLLFGNSPPTRNVQKSDWIFLPRGLFIGLAIAAPVGPIGVLCIRRTLAEGRLVGLLSGLGAATADMLYGAVAAFGITAVQGILLRQQVWLQVFGGLFLLYLGLRTFFAHPADPARVVQGRGGYLSAYLSTFALTVSNPATILSFTVIFAGLRLGQTGGSYQAAALLVLGVFLGSAIWWLFLSATVSLLRERFTAAWMLWVNRAAGILIAGFGVWALLLG
jgi:threonine/homoserine/homoserine lactone efflux protein